MNHWVELLERIERNFRAGRFDLAAAELDAINTADVPRGLRLALARLASHMQQWEIGLRLLAPLVRPLPGSQSERAGAREIAEYAGLLQGLGATDEALDLLRGLSPAVAPEAALHQAWCHMNRWHSGEAAECLRVYLRQNISAGERLTAKINLASASMGIPDCSSALALIDECAREAQASGQARLAAHCEHIRANILIAMHEITAARNAIEKAAQVLLRGCAAERRVIKQRRAFFAALAAGDPEPLLRFRIEAVNAGDWIALRETDFDALKVKFDRRRFEYLYFGTPYRGYRARILRELGPEPQTATYIFGRQGSRCLDLRTGGIDDARPLNAGKKTHQLLSLLLRDFYAPLRLGALFAGLFPGEHFDPSSSPGRVHQIFFRARQFLKEAEIPVEIAEKDGFYSLRLLAPFSFRLSLERKALSTNELHLQKLRDAFGPAHFDAAAARAALGLSPAGFKKFAAWAVENGKLSRSGSNRRTRYQTAPGSGQQSA